MSNVLNVLTNLKSAVNCICITSIQMGFTLSRWFGCAWRIRTGSKFAFRHCQLIIPIAGVIGWCFYTLPLCSIFWTSGHSSLTTTNPSGFNCTLRHIATTGSITSKDHSGWCCITWFIIANYAIPTTDATSCINDALSLRCITATGC